MQPYHHTIHKKHIKPSSCIAKFPYQLRMYKKYFLFSDHFSRNTVLFLLVYIMFFRTHLKISLFCYKYSLFSYLFYIQTNLPYSENPLNTRINQKYSYNTLCKSIYSYRTQNAEKS